jgi:hypothetical protein
MTTVFIGGSRRIARLNEDIKFRADNVIRRKMQVLIGDANGTDKAMQQYFVNNRYDNVVVYCMGEHCRNNLGNWPVRHIVSERNERDFTYYATKDFEMAKEASYGFMIWDGKSKGTLNNILNLLQQQKKVLVYFSPDRTCYVLNSVGDIRRSFGKYGFIDWNKLGKELLPYRDSITEELCLDLFHRQVSSQSNSYSANVPHTIVASVDWLLGVGMKL